MTLDNVKRDDWILGGVAILLVIDLLFLPWFDVSLGPISVTSTAMGAPDGWLGVLAVLALLALIADLAVERLSPRTRVPALAGSRTTTRLALGALAALFVGLKFLFNVHFSLFGLGFWGAVVLSAALLVLASRARVTPVLLGAAVSLLALLLAGCGGSGGGGSTTPQSSTPPSSSTHVTAQSSATHSSARAPAASAKAGALSGKWAGKYDGAFSGTFNLSWTESGSSLSGKITLSDPPETTGISGSVSGGAIKFGTVSGAVYNGTVSGGSMSGNYQTPRGGGSWSASKS